MLTQRQQISDIKMRWETDGHSDFSKRMVEGGQVRDLAQTENIKTVQRLKMGKSCELYEVEFLRDTAKSHHKARKTGFSGISQRSCCVLSEVGGCCSLLLNLPEEVQGSNWRLEDIEAEAKENSKGACPDSQSL